MMPFLHKLPLSELQLSLLAIGLIAIVLVWGYNFWQERKHRKQAQRIFRAEQSDVLMLKPEGDTPEQSDANANANAIANANTTVSLPARCSGSRVDFRPLVAQVA